MDGDPGNGTIPIPLPDPAAGTPDGGITALLIILFIFLIIAGAFFAAAESAFAAMNRVKIKSKAEDGDRRAKKVMLIDANFERAITALLIGNNITHIAAGSVAALVAVRAYGSSGIVGTLTTLVSTAVVFMFSEMIPKSAANDRADSLCLSFASPTIFFMRLFRPLTFLFLKLSGLVTKLFGKPDAPSYTEDEIQDIIDTAEEEGVVDEEQSDLIRSALVFSETEVSEIMTMPDDIVSADLSLGPDEMLGLLKETNHSRIPVCESDGNGDKKYVGLLNVRTYFRELRRAGSPEKLDVRGIITPVTFVPDDTPVDKLLRDMQKSKTYLTLVTDHEDGSVCGLVTIEDLLEELVGEIWDEDEEVDESFIKLGGNYFRAVPTLTCGDAFGRFGYVCKNREDARKTLRQLYFENVENPDGEEESFIYRGRISISAEDVSEDGEPAYIVIHPLDDDEISELLASAQKEAEDE